MNTRQSVSGVSRKSSTAELVHWKMSGSRRRSLMRSRDELCLTHVGEVATPAPVKFASKLQKLPLRKVLRRQRKFARLTSTAHHLVLKMAPTPLRKAMERDRDINRAFMGQATAEISARALACQLKLAE